MLSPDFNERPKNINPDQEPKDPRIQGVINELAEAARFLRNPRLSRHPERAPHPDDTLYTVSYESADRSKYVHLSHRQINSKDFGISNLPKQLREYEGIIPVNLVPNFERKDSFEGDIQVWLTLDENNPKIFQLRDETGEPIDEFIDARLLSIIKATKAGQIKNFADFNNIHEFTDPTRVFETIKAKERPDLLPQVLEAVSGNAYEIRDYERHPIKKFSSVAK